MDENEELDVTVEDEKSLEEQLAYLKSQVVTLTELVNLLYSEKDYELSYSGEQVDEVCKKVLDIRPSAEELNTTIMQVQNVIDPLIVKESTGNYGGHILSEAEALFQSNNGADISNFYKLLNTNGLKNLVLKWGVQTVKTPEFSGNGVNWWSSSFGVSLPSNTTDIAVIASCDFGFKHFGDHYGDSNVVGNGFVYKYENGKIHYDFKIMHGSDDSGSYTFKIHYLIIGKRTGGGKIG